MRTSLHCPLCGLKRNGVRNGERNGVRNGVRNGERNGEHNRVRNGECNKERDQKLPSKFLKFYYANNYCGLTILMNSKCQKHSRGFENWL